MFFPQKLTLNIRQNIMDLSVPKVMGIINLTTDSFYEKSRITNDDLLLTTAGKMLDNGADMLDIGAMSSRPGAQDLGEQVELDRLIPAIENLRKTYPDAVLSVDTFRASVARACIQAGADIINDISGASDPQMMPTVIELGAPYILMHTQGTPDNMQHNPQYKHVVQDVYYFFSEKLNAFKRLGGKDIILDPGFGFGKNVEHNYELLSYLSHFVSLNMPVLAGLSRKSMIYKTLDLQPEEILPETSALNLLALQNGANILRVHDVKEAKNIVKIYEKLKAAGSNS